MSGYAVRWVEAADVRHEALDIWNRNLAMKVTPQRRFEWLYRDNPIGPGRLAVLEALDDATGASEGFVGTAGHGRRAFSHGGRVLHAALMCDVAVDLKHRSAMPAFMVTSELRRHVLAKYDIAYGFPNHLSEPLVTRGYKKLGATRRYALVLKHERHVKQKIAQPLAARGAALALDAARAALVGGRAAGSLLDHRLVWLEDSDIDSRFDRLWQAAAGDYEIVGVRDAAFVRWRFLDRAEGRVALAGLVHRKTGELAGYAAVQEENNVAHVRDIFARTADLPVLLRRLAAALLVRRVDSISLRLTGPPAVIAALEDIGFRERADKRSFVVGVGKPSAALATQLYDPARWFLTEGARPLRHSR